VWGKELSQAWILENKEGVKILKERENDKTEPLLNISRVVKIFPRNTEQKKDEKRVADADADKKSNPDIQSQLAHSTEPRQSD